MARKYLQVTQVSFKQSQMENHEAAAVGGFFTTAAEATVDVHTATACRDPRGHHASQQSDGGIRVGGHRG